MLKCKDIVDYSGDYLDRRMSLSKRLSVWLHIMMCGHCRRYLRYLKSITVLLSSTKQQEADEELVDKVMKKIEADKNESP